MAEQKKERKQIARLKDYKQVFSSQAGQRVLHDLMMVHGMLQSTFSRRDVNEMLLKEGERNVVLRILTMLKTSPEQLQRYIEECERNATAE